MARRRQVLEMIINERNRLHTADDVLGKGIKDHITWLEQELANIDSNLRYIIRESPIWREKGNPLRSVPGVGPVLSATLLADLPELGTQTVGR